VSDTEPTLSQLVAVLRNYSQDNADASLATLLSTTGGAVDLTVARHRVQLRKWLNKWVCRLRYPRPAEPDLFSTSIATWWAISGSALPDCPVAELNDAEVGILADSYAELATRPGALLTRNGVVIGSRSIAPTAASKIMFVLLSETVSPWDAAIARTTAGGTSRDHFARHLKATRTWAQAVNDEARIQGITDIPAYVGRPTSSLAKLRDEWLYLTITRRCPIPVLNERLFYQRAFPAVGTNNCG
jgi:hypothetical protein